MDLKIFKALWGMTGPLEEQFERIVKAGYDGIECAAQEIAEPEKFKQLLAEYKLPFIALIYTEGPDHLKHFDKVVSNAMQFRPIKLVAHAGRDLMPFVKQIRFLVHALRMEESIGIPIAHETHRRRPLFSPMNTSAILRELPELNLNIDFSHWCCVTESLLEDHADAIERASERAVHLHGRVGYENGPQVPDPRVPEWSRQVAAHEKWWDRIIDLQKTKGESVFTFTPEYGPPSYMQTDPKSSQAVSDLWDVCLWSAERFRTQFSNANPVSR